MGRKWLCICMLIVLCALIMSTESEASTPRLMLSDYSVKGGTVVAGQDFDIEFTFQNESKNSIKNIKITILSDNGELLPVNGAGTDYIYEIKGGESATSAFLMNAVYGLEEKSYPLKIKTEYEGSNGMEYSVEEAVFLLVTLEQRISVTDVFIPSDRYKVGDTVEVSAVVNNLGTGTLYNVSAKLIGDNVDAVENYVGNVDAGKSGTIDLMTKASVVTAGEHTKNAIHIYYEDKAGNSFEKKIEIAQILVSEAQYDDFEVIKESEDTGNWLKFAAGMVVAILVILALGRWVWKRRQKKLAMLEEF